MAMEDSLSLKLAALADPTRRAIVARLDGMTAPEPRVPRKFRYAFSDRPAARAAMRRVLAWPAERLVIAHGPPIAHDAHAVVARAFRWLGV